MKYAMNSAVIAAGAYGTYEFAPVSWTEAKAWLSAGEVVSRIGYAETRDLIAARTGVELSLSRDASALAAGDEALVVRLKYRVADPSTKGARTGAGDGDWEIALLHRVR